MTPGPQQSQGFIFRVVCCVLSSELRAHCLKASSHPAGSNLLSQSETGPRRLQSPLRILSQKLFALLVVFVYLVDCSLQECVHLAFNLCGNHILETVGMLRPQNLQLALYELKELSPNVRQQPGESGQDSLRWLCVRRGPGSLAVHDDGLYKQRAGNEALQGGQDVPFDDLGLFCNPCKQHLRMLIVGSTQPNAEGLLALPQPVIQHGVPRATTTGKARDNRRQLAGLQTSPTS
mmetsp:Transcript_108450/g.187374  ORF Transcript_108450/g.187374 Transcript_108450/m.187374 type:complete len:234 (-) Transcript_108450:95-796(-)